METPSYIIALIVLLGSAVAWWGLLTGFTGQSRARFRTELWHLRDDLMDAFVLNGRRPEKSTLDLLEATEFMIRHSEQFTLFRVTSMYAFWKAAGSPAVSNKLDLKPSNANDELRRYKERLERICTKYLVTNSLFGWMTVFLPIVDFIAKLASRRRLRADLPRLRTTNDVTRRPIRIDIQAEAWADRSAKGHSTAVPV